MHVDINFNNQLISSARGILTWLKSIFETEFHILKYQSEIFKMKFWILTLGLVNGFTVTQDDGITEIYDTRDLWYGGEKLTITAYEKQGVGYFRLKGVDNWGFKWDKCNGPTRFLIRYFNFMIHKLWLISTLMLKMTKFFGTITF